MNISRYVAVAFGASSDNGEMRSSSLRRWMVSSVAYGYKMLCFSRSERNNYAL